MLTILEAAFVGFSIISQMSRALLMGLALIVVALTVPRTPGKVMPAAALATITMNKAVYPANSSQI
jgi:hypothetical protein